jgi:putative ATPase
LKEDTLTVVNPTDHWLLHLKREEIDGEEKEVPTQIVEMGGPAITQESDDIIEKFRKPIPFGNCVPTTAGDLPFKKVIHAVPPFYVDGGYDKPVKLKSCVWNSIQICGIMKYNSITIPALGTGDWGFTRRLSANCLFDEVIKYASKQSQDGKEPLVTDIRFTNEEDVTCKLFVQEFDRRQFD